MSVPLKEEPVAVHKLALRQEMLSRLGLPFPVGPAFFVQTVPFQDSTEVPPTARQLFVLEHEMPNNSATSGLCMMVHVVPFQLSTNEPLSEVPTALQFRSLTHETL